MQHLLSVNSSMLLNCLKKGTSLLLYQNWVAVSVIFVVCIGAIRAGRASIGIAAAGARHSSVFLASSLDAWSLAWLFVSDTVALSEYLCVSFMSLLESDTAIAFFSLNLLAADCRLLLALTTHKYQSALR